MKWLVFFWKYKSFKKVSNEKEYLSILYKLKQKLMTSKWFILSNNVILISILYEEKLGRYLEKEFLNFILNNC